MGKLNLKLVKVEESRQEKVRTVRVNGKNVDGGKYKVKVESKVGF